VSLSRAILSHFRRCNAAGAIGSLSRNGLIVYRRLARRSSCGRAGRVGLVTKWAGVAATRLTDIRFKRGGIAVAKLPERNPPRSLLAWPKGATRGRAGRWDTPTGPVSETPHRAAALACRPHFQPFSRGSDLRTKVDRIAVPLLGCLLSGHHRLAGLARSHCRPSHNPVGWSPPRRRGIKWGRIQPLPQGSLTGRGHSWDVPALPLSLP
jgi:hypothetical protein